MKTNLLEYHSLEISDVKKYLDRMIERDKKVLEMRYSLGDFNKEHTLKEIGEFFNLSGNRIRQIVCKALRRIKRRKEIDNMNDILKSTNMKWNLLSDNCIPPINKPVIVKDSRGSITITRLKYIWEHESIPIYFGSPTSGTYWISLPDIEIENPKNELIDRLLKPISELNITERSIKCLKAEGIIFIGDIVCNPWESMVLKIPHFGRKSLKELQEAIEKHGFNQHEECLEYFEERKKSI